MIKQLTLKDKRSLLSKYPLSESQLNYEFNRSKKKGVLIKDWLENKYNKVYPPEILYHFSYASSVVGILKWGIIFGDTVTSKNHLEGINAPQLTKKSKYHNVTSLPEEGLRETGYWRFTVKFDYDDSNLTNYKEYYDSKQITWGIASQEHHTKWKWGKIEEQYFYQGHIDLSKIIALHKYDFKTQKWIKFTFEDALKDIIESKVLLQQTKINLPRILGNVFNDKTGMVRSYYKENDKDDPMSPLYHYTDYIVLNSNKQQLRKWKIKMTLNNLFAEENDEKFETNWWNNLIQFTIKTYNKLVSKSQQVDFANALHEIVDEYNAIYKRVKETEKDNFKIVYPNFEEYFPNKDTNTIH